MSIDRNTRDELSVAAKSAGAGIEAAQATALGSIYYGLVYGETAADDVDYLLALYGHMYFWTRIEGHPWQYEGSYDARVCIPPMPSQLYRAWGLSLATGAPSTPRAKCDGRAAAD
ncbi:hypothetical protein ACFYOK_33600 [Microbispora bryophytorum]|uniref:hypothetical protein n=1 Tax=Microbispora bryophytorum TaxID=1460882 RepID=UPI0033FD2C8F